MAVLNGRVTNRTLASGSAVKRDFEMMALLGRGAKRLHEKRKRLKEETHTNIKYVEERR